MKKTLFAFCLVCLPAILSAQTLGIVPAPREVAVHKGFFRVKGDSIKGISYVLEKGIPAENYKIKVTRKGITVSASEQSGFLYAAQSLRQMRRDNKIPCCEISDGPRFAYRSLLLDPARHFWTVEETKKIIDAAAMYKLNRLHWHLSDDQGWRIEIKKYPKLTEVGAYRSGTQIGTDRDSNDGIPHGGFYSQEQIKDIVAYASDRGITIVPEIDLPGHMLAALASYPDLGCTGGPYKVWTRWGISEDVLCVGKEETFAFLEDVLSEVCGLFPSEYVCLGGDECPKKNWAACGLCQAKADELGLVSDDKGTRGQKLQNYVTFRMQKYLESMGKKVLGWDEILEGDLHPGATILSWRGIERGVKAAENGFDVIMTPNQFCYFDYLQSPPENEPLGPSWKKHKLPIETVYGYEPYDDFDEVSRGHVLGIQAALWTEYIATPEHLEYMLLPRLLAISCVQWCRQGARYPYADFLNELRNHQYGILKSLGYNFKKY